MAITSSSSIDVRPRQDKRTIHFAALEFMSIMLPKRSPTEHTVPGKSSGQWEYSTGRTPAFHPIIVLHWGLAARMLRSMNGNSGKLLGDKSRTCHTLIMGILNVTPDSFCDGGRIRGPEQAYDVAVCMCRDGADWIDVGGESSRPGAAPVGLDEELRRVLPVVEALRGLPAPVSVDTYRAETARRALAAGAALINDITALRGDPEMASVIAESACECVLMHMRGDPMTMQHEPKYNDVVDDICAFFEERLEAAAAAGIREERIWLDPGFGFGKTVAHNLELLRRLREFERFGRPVLIGVSNKSTIGKVLDVPANDRLEGTAAAVAVAIMNGADGVRVHDVRAMARVARMTGAILSGGYETHE